MRNLPIFVGILIILSAICIDNVQGTRNKRKSISEGWLQEVSFTRDSPKQKNLIQQSIVPKFEDTVYSTSTNRKNLWLVPINKVSEKEASRLSFVIRFSNRTTAGNYCTLEILGKGLKPLGTGMTMSISEFLPDSVVASSQYIQSMAKAHRLDFIPDYTGKHVLQEKLYDVDNRLLGTIVHQYQDNYKRASEHYIGPYGQLEPIANTLKNPMGLRLNIMFDKHGHDSLVYLTDGSGVVPNKDGAFYQQFTYIVNKNGANIRIQKSLDSDFKPMMDDYGNCGAIFYLDKYNNETMSTFIDTLGNPMALPPSSYDKNGINVSSSKYHVDYKRYKIDTIAYFGLNGEPVENILGTHKVVMEYDSFGNEKLRKGLDLNGNLAPIDESGIAKYTNRWDSLGNVTEYHQYDEAHRPFSKDGGSSSFYKKFDTGTHNETLNVGYEYNENTGGEELEYMYSYSAAVDSLMLPDKSCQIIRYDSLRRAICHTFLDRSGRFDRTNYCAIDSMEFLRNDGINKSINRQFRADGMLQAEYVYDSILNVKSCYLYDTLGYLYNTYQFRYDSDGSLTGQTDCNRFGIPCRSGGDGTTRFLHADVEVILDGGYNVIKALDEFQEPDYVILSNGEIFAIQGEGERRFGPRILRDESGNIISATDFDSLRNILPKVMSIEVVDSVAYSIGLRDNDVILKYGDYRVSLNNPLSEKDFIKQWTIRSVLDANDMKDMVVFRVEDAESGKFGLITIDSLRGTPSELGFIPHIRYLTDRQRIRILNSMANVGFILPDSTVLPKQGNLAVISYNEMYRDMRNLPYQSTVKDASILLGAIDIENNRSWTGLEGEDTNILSDIVDKTIANYNTKVPQPKYYFTTDGINTISLKNCGRIFDCYMTDNDYNKLESLYNDSESQISQQLKGHHKMNTSVLAGHWIIVPNDSIDYYPYGDLFFDKEGNVIGDISYYAKVPSEITVEKVGPPIFRISRLINGKYRIGETAMSFISDNNSYPKYECVSVENPMLDLDDLKTYFTKDVSTYTPWYQQRMDYFYNLESDLIVKSVDTNNLTLIDGKGNEIRLVKAKGSLKNRRKDLIDFGKLIGTWSSSEKDAMILLKILRNRVAKVTLWGIMDVPELHGSLSLWANLDGQWNVSDNNELLFSFDQNPTNISTQFSGGDTEDEKVEEFREEIKSQLIENIKETFSEENLFGKLHYLMDDELIFSDQKFTRTTKNKDCLYCIVEDQNGYLAQQGLSGSFVILKWCDWSCDNSIEEWWRDRSMLGQHGSHKTVPRSAF